MFLGVIPKTKQECWDRLDEIDDRLERLRQDRQLLLDERRAIERSLYREDRAPGASS